MNKINNPEANSIIIINGVKYRLVPCAESQPVTEKDWEVIAYKHFQCDRPVSKQKDGTFLRLEFNGQKHESEDYLKGNPSYSIHTVRRTSDETEWSVQMETEQGVIKAFVIANNLMVVEMENNPKSYWLDALSKPLKKAALLKSSDGVEVFNGDEYFFVSMIFEPTIHRFVASNETDNNPFRFKHRANAEAYIKNNKSEFSRRQILDALKESSYGGDISDGITSAIKQQLGITE